MAATPRLFRVEHALVSLLHKGSETIDDRAVGSGLPRQLAKVQAQTLGSTLEVRFELGQYDMADGFGRGLFLWFIGPVVHPRRFGDECGKTAWEAIVMISLSLSPVGNNSDSWVHTEFSTALVRAAPSIERAKRSHPVVFDRIHHTWQTGEVVE